MTAENDHDTADIRARIEELQRSRARLQAKILPSRDPAPVQNDVCPRSNTMRLLTDPRTVRSLRVLGFLALFLRGRAARRLLVSVAMINGVQRAARGGR